MSYDIQDPKDPYFKANGNRLCWGPTSGCLMYIPADEAKRWDGAEWANACLGSSLGFFSYAEVKITGRKLTKSPWGYGVKCQITTNKGTEDERKWSGWIVGDEIKRSYPW